MKRLSLLIGTAVLAGVPLFAQSSSSPKFEFASIQISSRAQPGMRGGTVRGGRYEIRNATMVDLIRTAYNVQPERISGGPSWLEWTRWDIAAPAAAGTTPAQLRDMLKALLAERFKLAVREDTTAMTGMALKVNGTHKLKESSSPGGCQGQGAPDANGVPLQTVTCKGQSMAQLAELLPRGMAAYFPNGQQLVDETGLQGLWDFEFKVHPRQMLARAGSDGISLDKALAEIGLKLEPKEMKVPAIVVDSVSAEFTPNAPDVARRLRPAPSPEFEVAAVKMSPPEATQPRAQLLPSGQVTASGIPLNLMITLAWDLPNEQYVFGPGFITSTRYDVTGRAFAGAANDVQLDEDIIRLMLRALIVERFQLKYRMEDRPMPAFVLKADNPKMTKANPATRTRCFEGAPPGSAAAARPPQFGRQVTCQNITMAQFGAWLPSIAGGYTRLMARDLTGLTDGYDFTLNFSPIGLVQGPRPEGGAAPGGTAAIDPTGALPLQDALRSQLGIRMEEEKRMVPVFVVDSVSEKPVDN